MTLKLPGAVATSLVFSMTLELLKEAAMPDQTLQPTVVSSRRHELRRLFPVLILGSLGVLCFDAVGSAASRFLGFKYEALVSGSMLIYAIVGAVAQRQSSLGLSTLAAMIVGLVDATLGWAVSSAIGPNTLSDEPITWSMVLAGLAFVLVMAAACGYAGALLGRIVRKPA